MKITTYTRTVSDLSSDKVESELLDRCIEFYYPVFDSVSFVNMGHKSLSKLHQELSANSEESLKRPLTNLPAYSTLSAHLRKSGSWRSEDDSLRIIKDTVVLDRIA